MNYIKQLNAYWNWVKLNELPSRAGYLYFALLDCANAAGWKSKFNAPNSTLQAMAGLSKTDLFRYRNILIQCGLICYTAGKKGSAGVYEIVPLYGTNIDTNDAISPLFGTNIDTNITTNMQPILQPICEPYLKENVDINKTETKTKTNTTPPTPSPDPNLAEVFQAWDHAKGTLATQAESVKLLAWLDQYGKEKLLYSIEQAVHYCHNGITLSYVEAVLKGDGKKKPQATVGGSRSGMGQRDSDDEAFLAMLTEIERQSW